MEQISIELAAKVANLRHYLRMCSAKQKVLPSCEIFETAEGNMWQGVSDSGHNRYEGRKHGKYLDFPGAVSCACLFDRIQIRPELMPRDASLPLNEQDKFRGDAPLGAGEPVPNLRLCGADPVGQGLLPAGGIACSLECFGR